MDIYLDDEFLLEFYNGTLRVDLIHKMDAAHFTSVIQSMKRRIDSLEASRDAWRSLVEGKVAPR